MSAAHILFIVVVLPCKSCTYYNVIFSNGLSFNHQIIVIVKVSEKNMLFKWTTRMLMSIVNVHLFYITTVFVAYKV